MPSGGPARCCSGTTSADGELGRKPAERKPIGSLCLKREIAAGAEAEYMFLLSWHFPNRTPAWCGWDAPKGAGGQDVIGNHYCVRFADAWAAAAQLAAQLPDLERRTRSFAGGDARSHSARGGTRCRDARISPRS